MNIKLSFLFVVVFPLFAITQSFAQKIYPTSLTTINYLDSAAVKKYQKKNRYSPN
jgi:hypothetical protein